MPYGPVVAAIDSDCEPQYVAFDRRTLLVQQCHLPRGTDPHGRIPFVSVEYAGEEARQPLVIDDRLRHYLFSFGFQGRVIPYETV